MWFAFRIQSLDYSSSENTTNFFSPFFFFLQLLNMSYEFFSKGNKLKMKWNFQQSAISFLTRLEKNCTAKGATHISVEATDSADLRKYMYLCLNQTVTKASIRQ